MAKKLRVAVLMGGPSGEREVSLASGREVVKALAANRKFAVVPIEVGQDGRWLAQPVRAVLSNKKQVTGNKALVPFTGQKDPKSQIDVAFIAMHGRGGEDGTIQGLLELIKIPYTGSGVLASALGMDKVRSLAIFRDGGLRVPEYQVTGNRKQVTVKIPFPVVTKPNYHGSSLGVSICRHEKELKKGIALAKKYDKDVIVQQFVEGVELTCAVLGNEKPRALPVIEVVANKGDFYDYRSKYEEGGSDHIIPARVPKRVEKRVKEWAIKAHQLIGCRGFSRVDFIWDNKRDKLHVLEINTIPGLTPTSLFPDAAKAVGISFSELLDHLVQLVLK